MSAIRLIPMISWAVWELNYIPNDMLGSLINMLANKDRNTDGWVLLLMRTATRSVDPGAVEMTEHRKRYSRVCRESGDAIAAIVELFNPVKYPNLTLRPACRACMSYTARKSIVKVGYSSY